MKIRSHEKHQNMIKFFPGKLLTYKLLRIRNTLDMCVIRTQKMLLIFNALWPLTLIFKSYTS